MSSHPKLKTAFRKTNVIESFYTGGPVAVTSDGTRLISSTEKLLLTHIESGNRICVFEGDSSSVTALAVSPSSKYLVSFYSSFALFIYELPSVEKPLERPINPVRTISRAHDAPVHVVTIDPSSCYLASGASDGVAKVWDITRGYVTHSFKGHGGVLSSLIFHTRSAPDNLQQHHTSTMQLVTGSVDTRIRIYDLSATNSLSTNAKPLAILEGHTSVPRGLSVSHDGKWLISGGRDSVVMVWDYEHWSQSGLKRHPIEPPLPRTIPVFQRIEALGVINTTALPNFNHSGLYFYAGGQNGSISIWDAWENKIIKTLGEVEEQTGENASENPRQILDVIYIESTGILISVHADQNIVFHSLASFSTIRQIVGHNDEVIDGAYLSLSSGSRDSHLALATNSPLIRLYSMAGLDVRLLEGHTDTVLCLKGSSDGQLLVSGSKDNRAIIWTVSLDTSQTTWVPAAILEGHTESVGSIAFSPQKLNVGLGVVFTGSQDRTIKMWDISPLTSTAEQPIKLRAILTLKAHEKDINSLDVSPDNSMLASGSQDKTVNIFKISYSSPVNPTKGGIKLLGTCKGHKRGVWDVKFSSSERVLATASGDKTIKIWSLSDFSCLKTLEGHTNSVLRIDFLNLGLQLVSSSSDGLVKLWNIREETCVATLDNHENKVWALAVSHDEKNIVSGGADSVVTFWEDCADREKLAQETEKARTVLKEQSLANFLAANDYRNAFVLALSMDQPRRLLLLLQSLKEDAGLSGKSFTGHPAVDAAIASLPQDGLLSLLRHVRNWNASATTSGIAQTVLHAIFKLRSYSDLLSALDPGSAQMPHLDQSADTDSVLIAKSKAHTQFNDLVEGLIPYTERHLNRMDRLLQESYVIDLIIGEMDNGLFVDNDMGES